MPGSASSGSCPEPERLVSLLDDTLPGGEEPSLLEHLEVCEGCRRTLERLGAGQRDWSNVLKDLGLERLPPEKGLEQAIAALQSDVGRTSSAAVPTTVFVPSFDFLVPTDRPGALGRLAHYEILEVIGRGGMGLVFRAHDTKLGRLVAVKVMSEHLAENPTARRRFLREARAAAAVRNQYVVTIYAVEEAEVPYLVMEYISGVSLQQRIEGAGFLDLKQILRIGMQAAAGLSAAHAQGVVHRDIKPGNILLEKGVDRVKISDFGLARALDDVSLTESGVLAGTPLYMAPEQARGEPADHRSDLFSLGSVLYAMCTGQSPFRGGSAWAVLQRVRSDEPRPVREINPEIPDWLAAVIVRLHAKAPEDRYQSAAEVARLLGRHLTELQRPTPATRPATSATPAVTVPPTEVDLPRRSRTGPGLAGPVALALSVVLACLAAFLRPASGPSPDQDRVARTDPPTVKSPPRAPRSRPEPRIAAIRRTPVQPAGKASSPRVLAILPPEGFYFRDYGQMQSHLGIMGIDVVVGSSSLKPAQPMPDRDGVGGPVKPDVTLAQAHGADYDALIFCGGTGVETYFGDGEVRRLITEALAAGRYVAALGTGPLVLAGAGVLRDKQATCFKYPNRAAYIERLERAGARWVDRPVVVDGQIITSQDPRDTPAFYRVVLEHLGRIRDRSPVREPRP